MIDNSINFVSIDNFIIDLEIVLKEYDKSLSLIRFGSSLKQIPDCNLDLDILLISDKSYYGSNFYHKLNTLKENLLNGISANGFYLENDELNTTVNSFLEKQFHFERSKVFSQFVFGPQIIYPSSILDSNIYLHFKGPLTILEYEQFSKALPFHSYSLKENHKIISQEFNTNKLFNEIILSINLLEAFNQGLYTRVVNSNSILEVKKCINKLVLNYNLFLKYSKSCNQHLEFNSSSFELFDLKEEFKYLFNQITN
jgi:hypothetical protein